MKHKLLPLLLLAALSLNAAPSFYGSGPRENINLAGNGWQAATADTFDLKRIPKLDNWKTNAVPTPERSVLPKSINSWGYPPGHPVKTYLEPDGKTFKVKKDLSAWYKTEVNIPAEALKNHTAHLTFGAVAFRSAYWVNGKLAAESIQSTLPRDFEVTKYLKPGKNEIIVAFTGREGIVDVKGDTYLAPSGGVGSGIHQYARLEFRPTTAIDDVFIKTGALKGKIEFEITIVNRSGRDSVMTPRVIIRSNHDPKTVYATFTGQPVNVPAGSERKVILQEKWKAPVLWDFDTPVLYNAEVELLSGDQIADRFHQRFGVRDFEIRGRDFFLNGRRVVLLRGSTLAGIDSREYSPRWDGWGKLNSIRMHLGFTNQSFLRASDEQGYLMVPEASWNWVNCYPAKSVNVWLPGTLEYFKGWIRQLRNHPSVVIWSLANETFWNRTLPEEMATAEKIVTLVRSMDSTRPLQGDAEITWNNRLDIVNIHYPEWQAGEINMTYPNAGVCMPNDTRYLRKGKNISSWRAKFDWDRPLVIGEYFCNDDSQSESHSSFMGDSVFNGDKWRKQRLTGMGDQNTEDFMNNLFVETLKKFTTEYRTIGVAGMNIWTGEKDRYMPKQVVRPYDFHPNGDAGKSFSRKVVILNDDRNPIRVLRAKLTFRGETVWEHEYKIDVVRGSAKQMDVAFPLPDVNVPSEARLLVAAFEQPNPFYLPREVSRFEETIHIVPEFNLSGYAKQTAVLNGTKDSAELLKRIGLNGVSGKITPETKFVVIPANGFRKNMAEELAGFAENGGVVLVLPQNNWQPFRMDLPERDSEHAATQAWMRTPSHPVLKNMKEGQFSYWKPDNIVSVGTFKKPFEGLFELPLDCGGKFGMRWTPLLEVPAGKGAFLLTTFDLEKASKTEPAARQLFANLTEYGCTRKSQARHALHLLAGTNSTLKEALELAGVEVKDGIGTEGAVLVDASASIGPNELAALKKALADGRSVWLKNFTPDSIGKAASLFPFKPVLKAKPAGIEGASIISSDPLMNGLANFDFFWYRGSSTNPKNIKVVAKTGDWVLESPWNGTAERLISPVFLTRIKAGRGTILFDTLQWERATAVETDKTLRIASTLVKNLGGSFQTKTNVNYKRFFVDLSKVANMGYYDRVENDGKGGWTDQGRNDMRLFLINHTGRMNASDDGAEVPVPAFPTRVDFNKVIYQLVDPKANSGKAVVSLGSAAHAPKLMRSMPAVSVNRKADVLWFLHSAGWVQGPTGRVMAEYTVRYDDGTTAVIPIRAYMEVGDWHNPVMLGAASVAWTGPNLFAGRVGLWTFPWKNPHPEKKIDSISLKGGLSDSQYVLVAITGGVKSDEADATVAEWDFENRKYVTKLYPSKKAPEAVKDGVLCGPDRNFGTNLKGTPAADAMTKPFSVLAEFTIKAKPDGYMSGIVQFAQYMHSGFRMVIHKNLKLNFEIFKEGEKKAYFLTSKNPLPLDKRTTVEIRFDGQKTILLINGKIDAIVSGPLPRPFNGFASFGNASGPQYHFNGILHKVQVKTPEK